MNYSTSDFDYALPSELIAQRPLDLRDQARLLCLDRKSGSIEHCIFSDIASLVKPGDRLVFNDTSVIPARIFAIKRETGVRAELLFIRPVQNGSWEALVKPGRRLPPGTILELESEPGILLEIQSVMDDGNRVIALFEGRFDSIPEMLEELGHVPLPPYIERGDQLSDRHDYQTVFARNRGAIAAPTAGLHFTESLIRRCQDFGVDLTFLTLHVGIGTFRPVKESDPRNHPMHSEEYFLSESAAAEIAATKEAGGRIIAVGTTVVRTLESCAAATGALVSGQGSTKLFIMPGYEFKVVDAMVTNFHLPCSTLLMLVSAFAGRDATLAAYHAAVNERYRFFSYGDAMFIS